MTNTVDSLMALAERMAVAMAGNPDACELIDARSELRTALTEALAAQPVREPLSDDQITTIGHIMATKYTHRSDPTSHAYGFVKHTLIAFVKAIERAHGIGGDK